MITEAISSLEIDRYAVGLPLIFLFSLFCGILQYLVTRSLPKNSLDPEIVGGFFQVIGTVYGILIGLVVFDATSRYANAHETVEKESKAIIQVFALSSAIKSDAAGEKIAKKIKEYNDEVVLNDWDILQNGSVNLRARNLLKEINDLVLSIRPTKINEQAILPLLIQASIDVWCNRISRFDVSGFDLPESEWALLIAGAFLTILTTFFYNDGRGIAQAALVFITTLILCSSLYAVLMFSEPYRGDFVVSKEPFIISQRIISGMYYQGK